MSIPLTASLCLALALMCPASMLCSTLPEDLDGSGDDLNLEPGSGSGDGSEQGEIDDSGEVFAVKSKDVNRNTLHAFDDKHRHTANPVSGIVAMANSKSFWQNKDVLAGVISGAVTGVVLAAVVAVVLRSQWLKKDEEGYTPGQQRASNEDYYRHDSKEVIV
ncbi:uncharacterized protein KZ484_012597 [Pholidichthys leucotaenia]